MPEDQSIPDYLVGFLRLVGRHTLLIALFVLTVAAGSLALAIPSAAAVPYQAEAITLLKPRNTDISSTTEAAPNVRSSDLLSSDIRNSPASISVLMDATDIASKTKQLAAQSTEANVMALASLDESALRSAISVDSKAGLFYIRARATSADAATWLANVWSQQAVEKLNRIYSPASANTSEALDKEKTDLDATQKNVEQFLAQNPISGLTQELTQTQAFLQAAATNNSANQIALYNNERNIIRDKVGAYHAAVYNTDQQLNDLKAFRLRIEQSPENPETLYANQATLFLLLGKVTGAPGADLKVDFNTLQTGKGHLTKASQLLDIDSTISIVQRQQDDVRKQINDLESKLNAPLPAVASASVAVPEIVQEQIQRQNELGSEIEQKSFQLNQLQKTRDLHQSTYDLLRSRLAEQGVREVTGGVVDIGSPASLSDTLHSRNPMRVLLSSTIPPVLAALVIGIVVAYLVGLARPRINSNRALLRRFRRNRARVETKKQEAST